MKTPTNVSVFQSIYQVVKRFCQRFIIIGIRNCPIFFRVEPPILPKRRGKQPRYNMIFVLLLSLFRPLFRQEKSEINIILSIFFLLCGNAAILVLTFIVVVVPNNIP